MEKQLAHTLGNTFEKWLKMHLEFILDNDNSFDNILWHSNTLDLLSKSIIAFVRLLCGEYLEINYLES